MLDSKGEIKHLYSKMHEMTEMALKSNRAKDRKSDDYELKLVVGDPVSFKRMASFMGSINKTKGK